MISNRIRKYEEMGYNVIEQKKARKNSMIKASKKSYDDMSSDAKIKYLENKNLYLEAEVKYLKN